VCVGGSDSEAGGLDDQADIVDGTEEWPPSNYDPYAPLALPFGPRTNEIRRKFVDNPIFADENDPDAIAIEESDNMFLLQLPTDLSRPVHAERGAIDISDEDGHGRTAPRGGMPEGHLGKIQEMSSGKVFLVTNDGKRFQVNSGMPSSFAEYISAIRMDPKDTESGDVSAAASATATGGRSSASSSSSSSSAGRYSGRDVQSAEVLDPTGNFYMLGRVTRKLVVIPDYDIGQPRKPTSSSTGKASAEEGPTLQRNVSESTVDSNYEMGAYQPMDAYDDLQEV